MIPLKALEVVAEAMVLNKVPSSFVHTWTDRPDEIGLELYGWSDIVGAYYYQTDFISLELFNAAPPQLQLFHFNDFYSLKQQAEEEWILQHKPNPSKTSSVNPMLN